MRIFFLIILFTLFSQFIYSADKLSLVNTILVIIDENENDKKLDKDSPVTDGIFNALWTYEQFIFFDMRINQALKINNNELDATGFALPAKNSGADSILLIKVSYNVKEEGDKIILNAGDVQYKLISLNRLDIVRVGKYNLNISETVIKKEKTNRLKKIGEDILTKILS